MELEFIKLDPDACGLKEVCGEVFILANSDGTVAYQQSHSFKTGIAIAVPKGKVVVLFESTKVGQHGVTLLGRMIGYLDTDEMRITLLNMSRTAFHVVKGMPLARLILMDAEDIDLLECVDQAPPGTEGQGKCALDVWVDKCKSRREETDEGIKTLNDQTVFHGAGKPGKLEAPDASPAKGPGAKAHQENLVPNAEEVNKNNTIRNAGGNPGPVSGAELGANKPSNTPSTV